MEAWGLKNNMLPEFFDFILYWWESFLYSNWVGDVYEGILTYIFLMSIFYSKKMKKSVSVGIASI
jgi:hypothetical protein